MLTIESLLGVHILICKKFYRNIMLENAKKKLKSMDLFTEIVFKIETTNNLVSSLIQFRRNFIFI